MKNPVSVWSMEFGMEYDLDDLLVKGLAIEDFKKKIIVIICHLTYLVCFQKGILAKQFRLEKGFY